MKQLSADRPEILGPVNVYTHGDSQLFKRTQNRRIILTKFSHYYSNSKCLENC